MKRRTVLLGLVTAIGSPGCIGASPGDPSPTATPTDTPPTATDASPTPTVSPPGTPSPPDFAVTDRSCGNGGNDATVSFEDRIVRIAGTIPGRDTCDTAVLDGVEWEGDALTVRVAVVTEKTDETVACAECITDIDYTAAIDSGDRTVSEVTVVHTSASGTRTVATAEP